MNRRIAFLGTISGVLGVGACLAFYGGAPAEAQAPTAERPLLLHLLTDANSNDANACVAFNLAWVAIEQGHPVEMLFDGWASYNIKTGDFWAKYRVPEHFRKLVSKTVGHDVEWGGGTYVDLLKYLHGKGLVVAANKTFLALSGDDKKLPSFVEQWTLAEMVTHLRGSSGYASY